MTSVIALLLLLLQFAKPAGRRVSCTHRQVYGAALLQQPLLQVD
jgi:hypothetical protein